MAPTPNAQQKNPTTISLAESLGIDQDDVDLLEGFFVEFADDKSLSGTKIFNALTKGASFGQALGISNNIIELLYARAHRWVAVARYEKAEPIFRALCVIDASSADFWVGLGICLQARSAWDDALAAFTTASAKKRKWEIPHFHALDLCMRRKDWDQAATELAAFERKADNKTSPAIVAEVNKYKTALQLRGRSSKRGALKP
jgi:tetratricopeptide (TPR) repeat protein